MSATPPVTRLHAKGVSEPGAEHYLPETDSDFTNDEEAIDDRKPAIDQAVAKPEERAVPSRGRIGKNLKDLIMNSRRGLKNMYGKTEDELDKSLQEPIKKGEEMARKLIYEMGCDIMSAIDLTVLTLYDMAILIGTF